MALKCPNCGSTKEFVSNQYIEHHDAIFNGDGIYIEDADCYESYHDTDGATCQCCECDYEGEWSDFEYWD